MSYSPILVVHICAGTLGLLSHTTESRCRVRALLGARQNKRGGEGHSLLT
jgi:hypothetical protein